MSVLLMTLSPRDKQNKAVSQTTQQPETQMTAPASMDEIMAQALSQEQMYETQEDAFVHETQAPLKHIGVDATHGLFLAGVLFVIGLAGVIARRNFLFMLMSLEIMMNAAALAFVMAGNVLGGADGQVMFVFILTLAAAEAAIGLAILLQFYHRFRSLDVNKASSLKG